MPIFFDRYYKSNNSCFFLLNSSSVMIPSSNSSLYFLISEAEEIVDVLEFVAEIFLLFKSRIVKLS